MPFRSKKQWKWAFANKKPFAHRWSHMRSYSSLPASKDAALDAGAPLHGPGGLLATPGLGARRKTRRWGVRTKATQIVGNLYRGDTGKFQAGGAGTAGPAQRGIQLSKQPKPTTPSRTTAPKGGKGGKKGGKGGAAAKPKKIAQTPEQKRQQHAAEQAQNRADVLGKLNIAPDGQAALSALREGQQPDPATLARGGFVEAGLVEQANDGSYRLTSSGRALLSAADAGDAGRAGDTISSGRDRVGARTEREQAAATRHADAEKKRAEREQAQAAAAKKPSGGGGGSSKQPVERIDRGAERAAERQQQSAAAVNASGIGDQGLADLRTAAEAGGVKNQQLAKLGLIGADGMTTDQGRRALSALEHGNVRQYQAALQDAKARMERERAAQQRQQATQARQIDRRGWAGFRPRHKSFAVFKDASGQQRWIARTTTAYRDRDGEILSVDALDRDSQRMTATKQFGPLRWWHVGDPDPLDAARPWGPGLDIGDCDYSVVIGRTRVESGTFRDPLIARKMARIADQLEMSPGFFHPADQPGADGVFTQLRTFERSPVPTRYSRASNLFTGFAVKESRMNVDEMERRFKAMIDELQLAPAQAQELAAGLVQTEKAASEQRIAFKSDEAPEAPAAEPPADIVLNGITYTVKAASPPPVADAAPDVAVETQADGMPDAIDDGPDDEMAEDTDVIGNMSVAEFEQMLSTMLAPVLKMQDMVKSIGDTHAELKGMFGGVATKEEGRAAEIAALKARQQELETKLAELTDDQPAVTLPADVEAALKSAGPAAPPDSTTPEVPSDPTRPWAGWGALTFPELYGQPPQNSQS